jgi:hypothetical protein
MRNLCLIIVALCFAVATAEAKPEKKKPSGKYNATAFIKTKEAKAPVVTSKDKVAAENAKIAGLNVNCTAVETSPTTPAEAPEKAVDEAKTETTTNSTQKALDMAKTVIKTVKDNCRPDHPAAIKPEVGVQVVEPGDLGTKESKGERPELSGTVGVNATF